MGVNRFAKIMQLLHYDKNLIPASNGEDYKKCYKIQPLVDYIREKLFEVVVPETYVAVDEPAVPYNGASSPIQWSQQSETVAPEETKNGAINYRPVLVFLGMSIPLKCMERKAKLVLQMGEMRQKSVAEWICCFALD